RLVVFVTTARPRHTRHPKTEMASSEQRTCFASGQACCLMNSKTSDLSEPNTAAIMFLSLGVTPKKSRRKEWKPSAAKKQATVSSTKLFPILVSYPLRVVQAD